MALELVRLAVALVLPQAAMAQPPVETAPAEPARTPSVPQDADAAATNRTTEITITGRLDATRDLIAPSLGAVTYTIDQTEIRSIGQGEDGSLQQISIQAPGAYEDEYGEVHVRGDHGDLQYRINGVLLPEQLNGFGQEVDPRIIRSLTLIDGSLPAQFGDRTAGIFDVTTKSGSQLNDTQLSLYGGSRETFNQSILTGASAGNLEYFVAVSHNHDDIGIDNPTSSVNAVNDSTDQERAFGYFSYRTNDDSRITLLLNGSVSAFQIPDTPGLTPSYALAEGPAADSATVNDHQQEQNYYAVLSYQTTVGKLSAQISAYTRYTDIAFTPDDVQDLLFGGVAATISNTDWANGVQAEVSDALNNHHTLRFGSLVNYDSEALSTAALTFPATQPFAPDAGPTPQASDRPIAVSDVGRNAGVTAGAFLQDEWKLNGALTINYGVRYDIFNTNFDRESQVSPRINAVLKIDDLTTAHVGYSRYFTPPTLQFISSDVIADFANTTNAPFNATDIPQKAERANYVDVGVSRQMTRAWFIDLDSFGKFAKNLLDDGQFGNAVILNNFNYTKATIYGAELSTTYKHGSLSAYANFSYVHTFAQNVDSSQYEFPSDELAYIAANGIQLDHQQTYSVSGGGSYTWRLNTRFYGSFLYGDGLRAGFANLEKLPSFHPISIGVEQTVPTPAGRLKIRFDCINLFDETYELRNGSGLGIAAPAFGPRRGVFGGVSYDFL